jgi:ribosome maturation factor RimP
MSGRDHFYQQAEGIPRGAQDSEREFAIRRIVEPILSALGLVLAGVELRGRGGNSLVRVVIERPAGDPNAENVTVQDCERAHVLIGHALDVEDPIPHGYVLEVSSPGLDRPIRSAVDYERFQGRLARFKLAKPVGGQAVVIGRIQKLENGQVWIETPTKGRQRRSGPQEATSIALYLEDIREARLEVEF